MKINNENISLSERINEAFKTKKMKQIDLVNKYEYLSPALVNKFFNSQKTVTDILVKLCVDENINIDWLCTGRGNMFLNDNQSSNINVNNSNIAVNNGNGTITINANDYVDSNEIKELLELLKDVPKSWIKNIIERLKKSLNAIEDFK